MPGERTPARLTAPHPATTQIRHCVFGSWVLSAARALTLAAVYAVDERDRVVPLDDLPQSSVGAPCPLVMQDEHAVVVAYYLDAPPPGWTGETVRIVDPEVSDEPAALVIFRRVCASMFGPPNDEAFRGHPLAARGLRPYSAARIEDSSWIRILERINSVHPYHRPERYAKLRHFVLAFHDSTFECVAGGYDLVLATGPLDGLTGQMLALLREGVA